MILIDTNVLVNAHRPEADRHGDYRDWLLDVINSPEPYAIADFALLGMVRIVTSPRIYSNPTPPEIALEFAERLRSQPHAMVVAPGARFWPTFRSLCEAAGARGNLIPDAYLAALAIEHGCELFTADSDFKKFPGLRFSHPLI
ncbi:MAG TPA: type II toxin-antitoxin system VapC family toxin [Trebonia sp.]|nr:type II toxin-antitoxin system VapC family toxin [Trebonia sp.]